MISNDLVNEIGLRLETSIAFRGVHVYFDVARISIFINAGDREMDQTDALKTIRKYITDDVAQKVLNVRDVYAKMCYTYVPDGAEWAEWMSCPTEEGVLPNQYEFTLFHELLAELAPLAKHVDHFRIFIGSPQ